MAVYFSIILVVITIVTGIVWLVDKFYLAKQRQIKVDNAQSQCAESLTKETIATLLEPSTFVDTAVQMFPVIAFVLVLHSSDACNLVTSGNAKTVRWESKM